jgi:hypothetical protein
LFLFSFKKIIHVTEHDDAGRKSCDFSYDQQDCFYSRLTCLASHLFAESDNALASVAQQLVDFMRLTVQLSLTEVNGCLSFDRRFVPLSSTVAKALGIPDDHVTNPAGASLALDLVAAQHHLATRNAAIPQWNASYHYSLHQNRHNSGVVEAVPDRLSVARQWMESVDRPDEIGCNVLRSTRSAEDERKSASAKRKSLKALIAEIGQVYRVDIVVQRRRLLGGIVSDYFIACHPPRGDLPRGSRLECCCGSWQERDKWANGDHVDDGDSSTDDAKMMKCDCDDSRNLSSANVLKSSTVGIRWPTALPDDKRDQLVIAAYQCCNELDLVTGVFTVDMTFNVISPKMIRVLPCLDLTSADDDDCSTVVSFLDGLLAGTGVDLVLYALLMAGRHGRPQPVLPVYWSYMNHLGCRRLNYEQFRRPYDVKKLATITGNYVYCHCDDR